MVYRRSRTCVIIRVCLKNKYLNNRSCLHVGVYKDFDNSASFKVIIKADALDILF